MIRKGFVVSISLLLLTVPRIDAWSQLGRRGTLEHRTLLSAKKFAQPEFRQAAHQDPEKRKQQKQRNQPKHKKQPYASDSKIGSIHAERIKTSGRVGTKRYVNPYKVFIANMPFDIDQEKLTEWLTEQMGQPATFLLNDVKVVRDWKTGKSKGFAFVVFTEPIYASVCIEKCHRTKLGDRFVTVSQGRKKQDTTVLVKKKKAPVDAEEAAIQAGLAEAEEEEELDPQYYALLRTLDPDLLPDHLKPSEDEAYSDSVLFSDYADDDGDDDDDDGVDGIWYGEDDESSVKLDPNVVQNREQRRAAARQQKRKKPKYTGFGAPANGDS